ncbi:hypothetical protein NliqN6_3237 [Naganishia liquefaciens]|uniref:WD40 repeat domain-containing protein n=1 Tax=Naganishia liquefaciens TaxID=104408 RepID=A0A8H3TUB6_9TREE|nr:hypothetical protein NliqN6_3237 [Naganishia liquefaciens]
MTRTTHHAHPTPGFPVFCIAFTDDTHLLLGGGGGASRTGILNKLKLYAVDKTGEKFEALKEHVFEKGADSPNTLAVDVSRKQAIVGVNQPVDSIQHAPEEGNRHCRLLDYSGDEFKQVAAVQTITEPWSDNYPYQKHTSLNPRATLVAIATTNYDASLSRISILSHPDLCIVVRDLAADVGGTGAEVVDLDWSADGTLFAVTTPNGVDVYSVDASTEKDPRVTFEQTIPAPGLDANPVVFRAARFARAATTSPESSSPRPQTLHCILNARPQAKPRTRKPGAKRPPPAQERAYAVNLSLVRDADEGKQHDVRRRKGLGVWDIVARRDIGGRPVTAMQISGDGKLLAYASSDLSIGIFDARTLTPLLKILHAHSFPTTALAFNPSGTLLASSSADNTVRLVVVPESFGSSSMMVLSLVVALLLVLIALYIQYRA